MSIGPNLLEVAEDLPTDLYGQMMAHSSDSGWFPVPNYPQVVAKVRKSRNNIDYRLTSRHPNLVPEHTCPISKGIQVTIAHNYIGTSTLEEKMNELSVEQRVRVTADAMEGCTCLHSEGLVHDDVHPGNVFVIKTDGTYSGKLFDFECLREEGRSQHVGDYGLFYEGTYLGNQSQPVDRFTDIFSFGMILLASYVEKEGLFEVAQRTNQYGDTSTEALGDDGCFSTNPVESRENRFLRQLNHLVETDEVPEQMQILIKRMLNSNRESRPELSQAAAVIKNVYQ